jgi:hypothetical protein
LVFRFPGTRFSVRAMFVFYWVLVLGGLALWIAVGFVVD